MHDAQRDVIVPLNIFDVYTTDYRDTDRRTVHSTTPCSQHSARSSAAATIWPSHTGLHTQKGCMRPWLSIHAAAGQTHGGEQQPEAPYTVPRGRHVSPPTVSTRSHVVRSHVVPSRVVPSSMMRVSVMPVSTAPERSRGARCRHLRIKPAERGRRQLSEDGCGLATQSSASGRAQRAG